MRKTAYAKINLALHVRRRREDGYHDLETLFAFVDVGDELIVSPGGAGVEDAVIVKGEFADAISDPFANIVAKALLLLPRLAGWRVDLNKRLPVAAGLGGGSADAGAIFRLIDAAHGLPSDWLSRAKQLGADVPACIASRTVIGRGTGVELEAVEDDLAGTPVLLVNPRVPLATGPVFRAWDGIDRGALPSGAAGAIARGGRNDLEAPAIALCPVIAEVLDLLRDGPAWLTRMSGSGATCFALFGDEAARDAMAARIADVRPRWWRMTGRLRGSA